MNDNNTRKIIRAFFAIGLDEQIQMQLSTLIADLSHVPGSKNVRWIQPEKLHITLKFLGNIELDELMTKDVALKTSLNAIEKFTINLNDVHLFPAVIKPHMVALKIEPATNLKKIITTLESHLQDIKCHQETREFNPHLSLGRIIDQPPPNLAKADLKFNAELTVAKVMLYKSTTLPSGATYEIISNYPLKESSS